MLCGRWGDELNSAPCTHDYNVAYESMCRAVLVGALKPIEPVEARRAEGLYGRHRFFKPSEVVSWAEGKFEKFPFSKSEVSNAHADQRLGTRERNTLLVIIAALAREADIPLDSPTSTRLLQSFTEKIGSPVGDETIRKILKAIPEALERRSN